MADRKPDMDVTVQQGLRELMQDDYPLLLETFLADAGKRLRQLHDALAQGDMNAYRQAAHSFKGSAGNMGALALEQACLDAEAAGEKMGKHEMMVEVDIVLDDMRIMQTRNTTVHSARSLRGGGRR